MPRDNPGPRAMPNALERLADGYAEEKPSVEQDQGSRGPAGPEG